MLEKFDLYSQGMFEHVIVSVGISVEGFSGAYVVADHLAHRHALLLAAILMNEHGDYIEATPRNSAAVMHAHGFRSALVATQHFDIVRCHYALCHACLRTVHSVHGRYVDPREAHSLARELLALPMYRQRSLREQ
ncbi:hypothetical protein HH212_23405 [Massilia forsythiae]|uniref:Uncharacterized protein n=1 Tax=Massilia forsythiae TaxID=2728020 RepID=A0A7Z2W184_9BURK|nr:hypothetical protein [Massilia forsythiae]QJE02602.1 hypothetical protein HH212_23405 [Massilia forsythiae]